MSCNRKMWEQADFLDDIADPPAQTYGIPIASRFIFDEYLAGRGFQQPIDQFQGRRLSGSTSSEKDDCFAGLHLERYVLHEGAAIDGVCRIAEFQGRRHSGSVSLCDFIDVRTL